MAFWRAAGHGTRRVWFPLLAFGVVLVATVAPGGAVKVTVPPEGPAGSIIPLPVGVTLDVPLPFEPVPGEPAPPAGPHIVVDPPAWDFGDADAVSPVSRVFTIRNDGNAETQVNFRMEGTGSFSATNSTCGTLGPGGQCELTVHFPGQGGYGYDAKAGEHASTLRISSDYDGRQPLADVPLSGRVVLPGYYLTTLGGRVYHFGGAVNYGDARGIDLKAPVVTLTPTPTGTGYWLAAADGGIFSYGDARFFGSTGNIKLNSEIVGIAATPSGNGYWMVAADGGIFCFGDAGFHGSTGGKPIPAQIVTMARTPSGNGYWLTGADGSVYPFGDAADLGSMRGTALRSEVFGMTPTPAGDGYWLAATDGSVFNFGAAGFHGSMDPKADFSFIVAAASSSRGGGYWLADFDGKVFGFGDAQSRGGVQSGEFGYGDYRTDAVIDLDAMPVPPRQRP